MYCPECGTKLGDNMKFCPACGQAVPPRPCGDPLPPAPKKQSPGRVALIILYLLLSVAGLISAGLMIYNGIAIGLKYGFVIQP